MVAAPIAPGAYIAHEQPNDIVFVADDINAEELAVTGLFFMQPAVAA